MAKSYVYRCEHKISKRFYIGYRKANTMAAKFDFGTYYFTSCPEVSNNFNDYTYEILSEYDSALMAYEVEQAVIYELRHDPFLINKNYKTGNHIMLDPKPAHMVSSNISYKERKFYLKKLPPASVVLQRNKIRKRSESEKSVLNNAGFEQYISIYKKLKSNRIDAKVKKFFRKKKLDINIYINNPELLEYRP